MGDEADYLIECKLSNSHSQPRYYEWITQNDSRVRQNAPHAPNCKCPGCVHNRIRKIEEVHTTERLSIERAFKRIGPYDVPTHIVCKRCQATGLHWGVRDGKPEMREEGGWPHKCKKIEGVTLNLPNILDPQ
jgi:hypothetical protein